MPTRTEQIGTRLAGALSARRSELEETALARALGMPSSEADLSPEYASGLRAAVSAAVDYALAGLEADEDSWPPAPTVLLVQARLAARYGVRFDIVLRRYLAGYTLLTDHLLAVAQADPECSAETVKRLLRRHSIVFDRLLGEVGAEYWREASLQDPGPRNRQADRVERLLRGELVDTDDLHYPLDGYHLGLVVTGDGAAGAIQALAGRLDQQLLEISRPENVVWAWLGSRRSLDPQEVVRTLRRQFPSRLSAAIGEPGDGVAGWRLTHRQARAAFLVALRGPEAIVRYGDVALIASALQDDLLSDSLRKLYLEPIGDENGKGRVARETLGAYLDAGQNVTSAAAALGISRQAVTNRLRGISERLGRQIDANVGEISVALHLSHTGDPGRGDDET
jgi:hypothetical protein